MTRSYEELIGGLGRAVTYRPKRHLVREFLAEHAADLVLLAPPEAGDISHSLHDISMNGASFMVEPGSWEYPSGSVLGVAIRVRGEPVFQGEAMVARSEESNGRLQVGLHLVGGFLDLPKIRALHQERDLERDLLEGPVSLRSLVPDAYRSIVDQASHFLHFYEHSLTRHEKRYAEMGEARLQSTQSLAERAIGIFRPQWNRIRKEAAETVAPCLDSPDLFRAAKRYTETMLLHLVMDCPVLERCYTKPLGYPGDYQTMAYIYRNTFEGSTAYARVMHKLACEEPLAAGVRTRKDFVKELTESEQSRIIQSRAHEPIVRIASLGSGLAREVVEFIQERRRWPGRVHWTLIDQDEAALSLAYQDVYEKIIAHDAAATVQCMYSSFIQLLRKGDWLPLSEPQDFIYAVGIFDYLRERSAKELVAALFEHVAPGGLLAICNASWPSDHFWVTEFIVDWALIYRTREEMLHLADRASSVRSVEVCAEPSNAYYYLLMRKS